MQGSGGMTKMGIYCLSKAKLAQIAKRARADGRLKPPLQAPLQDPELLSPAPSSPAMQHHRNAETLMAKNSSFVRKKVATCLVLLSILSADAKPVSAENSSSRDAVVRTRTDSLATTGGSTTSTQLEKAFNRLKDFDCANSIADSVTLLLKATKEKPLDTRKTALYMSLIGRAFQFDENELPASQCFYLAHILEPKDISTTAFLSDTLDTVGRHTDAKLLNKQVEPLASKNPSVAETLARQRMRAGDYPKTREYLEKSLANKSSAPNAALESLLARCLVRQGFDKQAVDHFRNAAKLTDSPYIKHLYRSIIAVFEDNPQAEEENFQAAGRILPSDPSWHTGLAFAYEKHEKDTSAFQEFQNATQVPRFTFRAFVRFASFLNSHHRSNDALRCLDYLDRVRPWSTQTVRAQIYSSMGEKQKALVELRKVLAQNPSMAPAYLELAQIYTEQHKPDLAIATLRKGVELCPNFLQLRYKFLCSLVREGLWEEAIATAHQLLAIAPKPIGNLDPVSRNSIAFAHAVLGTNYFRTNRLEDALAQAKMFNELKFMPNLPAHLRLIKLRPAQINYSEIEPKLIKSIDRILLADMLEETRQYNDSINEFRKAIELDPDNLDYHSYLLNELESSGNWFEAAKEDFVFSQKLVSRVPHEIGKWTWSGNDKSKK
jgi:tetratricopeptide (TPR) repeat protein